MTEIERRLFQAIEDGSKSIVEAVLEKGVDPNTLNKSKISALSFAADINSPLEVIFALIKGGAHIDPTVTEDLLHRAIKGGHLELVKALVDSEVEVENLVGEYELDLAIDANSYELVSFLLDNDAAPDWGYRLSIGPILTASTVLEDYLLMVDKWVTEHTVQAKGSPEEALKLAMDTNDPGLSDILFSISTGPTFIDDFDMEPVLTAIETLKIYLLICDWGIEDYGRDYGDNPFIFDVWKAGLIRMARMLAHTSTMRVLDDNLNPPITTAYYDGEYEFINFLAEMGVTADSFTDNPYRMPLGLAISSGDLDGILEASKWGHLRSALWGRDEDGAAPWIDCVEKGEADAVEFCLENGANPLFRGVSSTTWQEVDAFDLALARFEVTTLQVFLNSAPPASLDGMIERLGEFAVSEGQLDKLELAIKASVNLEALSSALEQAIKDEKFEIILHLIEAGVPINPKNDNIAAILFRACEEDKIDLIKAFLKAGVPAEIQNKDSDTLLMHAASYVVSAELVQALLDSGANVNSITKRNGWTPLIHAATYNASSDVVQALLTAGADVNARSTDGMSPLLRAAQHDATSDVIKLLLNNGADINAQNDKGQSALEIAVISPLAHPAIIELLLDAGADINAPTSSGESIYDLALKNQRLVDAEVIKRLR